MGKRELKKYLIDLGKTELTKIILDTYSNNKDAKEYLDYIVSPNEKEQFLKAKKIIEEEYFPEKTFPPKSRLSVAKKAIRDFSRLNPSPEREAELLIFLVEQGCEFTNEYGDMEESFYESMENNFERALKFMHKHDLLEKFKEDAENCLELASVCGYGFYDELVDIFFRFYDG